MRSVSAASGIRLSSKWVGPGIVAAVALVLGVLGGRITATSALISVHRSEPIVTGSPASLMVIWQPSIPSGGSSRSATVAGSDPRAQTVIADLNALPYLSGGVSSCPADDDSQYKLQFDYSNGDRWTVTVDATGCRTVMAGGVWAHAMAFPEQSPLLEDLSAIVPSANQQIGR